MLAIGSKRPSDVRSSGGGVGDGGPMSEKCEMGGDWRVRLWSDGKKGGRTGSSTGKGI